MTGHDAFESEPGENDADGASDAAHDLPAEVVDEAERLRRLERNAVDEEAREAYADRRERLLDEHDYTEHVRADDGDEVLVLHPEEWHDQEAGVIRTDRIEDLTRAVEIPLDGPGDPEDWETVDERNRSLAAEVRDVHGDVHGDTAEALADFMGNHYAKPITSASSDELAEFRSEYFVRNAWPTEAQLDALDDSLERIYETAEKPVPEFRSEQSR